MYDLFFSDTMGEEQNDTAIKKINKNWVKIQNSFLASELSGELIQNDIITAEQWCDIKSKPESEKIGEFLCILQKKKPAAHDAFVEILTRHNFDWNTDLNGASIVRGQCTY